MIQAENVSMAYGDQQVLDQISFSARQGECLGIIGPNGSGKSTLLKLLSGVQAQTTGRITLNGKPVEHYTRKQLAKLLSVLQQEALSPVGFTVREVVQMGRYPFQNWLGQEREDCESLIDSILQKMGLTELSDRHLEQLSGGERQRVALGKTMAQQPKLLMLDEPTTYLDIGHQIHLMDRIREWQQQEQMTVIAVLHDLNLAAMYCDRLLLLHKGQVIKIATPEQVIRAPLIEQVYGTIPVVIDHPVYHVPQIILQGNGIGQDSGHPQSRKEVVQR
ncbi:ABC transporter ATP-binding protein [Ammoniphilus oxalaticus]|uniref:ABC transporter ATP-binding protein n=1 Tax=Ammoniphilus oxalaticus TaxID=66863 RepID=A0A419SDD9_9BACL|nr:heme ABC transporter ATP-binding protein [Ammoniphilus oxalaticus]RKD21104.1 ABC transporter ATP-binding protein [Ammoniphilus oxalaticus]